MSILSTTTYTDFKTAADTKRFKDVFYYDNGGSIFLACAVDAVGFTVYSGNLTTQPVSFLTDYPNAISLPHIFTVS